MSKHKNELVITGYVKKVLNPLYKRQPFSPAITPDYDHALEEVNYKVTFYIEVLPLHPSTVNAIAHCHLTVPTTDHAEDVVESLTDGRFVHVRGKLNIWPHTCHTAGSPSHFDIQVEVIDFISED